MDELEKFWQAMLSGDAGAIRRAWNDLTDEEARAVAEHLRQMAADATYSAEQRQAAQAALEAIQEAG